MEVRDGNAAARALYRSAGFAEVGRRRRYYPDGEDAILLLRSGINPAPATAADDKGGVSGGGGGGGVGDSLGAGISG